MSATSDLRRGGLDEQAGGGEPGARVVAFWRSNNWVWEEGQWRDRLHWERGHWPRKPTPAWQNALSTALLVLLGLIVLLYRWGATHGASLPPLAPASATIGP
jgi:hypothetical protein